jgi:hypothetical protein
MCRIYGRGEARYVRTCSAIRSLPRGTHVRVPPGWAELSTGPGVGCLTLRKRQELEVAGYGQIVGMEAIQDVNHG